MTQRSLDKHIKYYRKVAKTEHGNQSHYALGALEVLERVKTLRDQIDEEAKDLWHRRGEANGQQEYGMTRHFEKLLSNVMEDG